MIYEFRTYDLKPRSVPEFERRFAEKLPGRVKYSPLAGFWHTEVGPLNQVLHIWPYEDLAQRSQVRAQAVADGVWPPDAAEFIVNMRTEIFLPAPFMKPMEPREVGPIFELRIYTYAQGSIPKVLEAWAQYIEGREKYSPLIGCWYSEIGDLNRFAHMWAYRSFEERLRIRQETREKGVWPPRGGVAPLRQENKILLPADFSPIK